MEPETCKRCGGIRWLLRLPPGMTLEEFNQRGGKLTLSDVPCPDCNADGSTLPMKGFRGMIVGPDPSGF